MLAERSASLDEPSCRRLLATEARQTIGSSYVPPCGEPVAAMGDPRRRIAATGLRLVHLALGGYGGDWRDNGQQIDSRSDGAEGRYPRNGAPLFERHRPALAVGSTDLCRSNRSRAFLNPGRRRGNPARRRDPPREGGGRRGRARRSPNLAGNDPRMAPVPSRAEGGPAGD